MKSIKQRHNVKTEKKNRVIVEEVNPNELAEIWQKLGNISKLF